MMETDTTALRKESQGTGKPNQNMSISLGIIIAYVGWARATPEGARYTRPRCVHVA